MDLYAGIFLPNSSYFSLFCIYFFLRHIIFLQLISTSHCLFPFLLIYGQTNCVRDETDSLQNFGFGQMWSNKIMITNAIINHPNLPSYKTRKKI